MKIRWFELIIFGILYAPHYYKDTTFLWKFIQVIFRNILIYMKNITKSQKIRYQARFWTHPSLCCQNILRMVNQLPKQNCCITICYYNMHLVPVSFCHLIYCNNCTQCRFVSRFSFPCIRKTWFSNTQLCLIFVMINFHSISCLCIF